MGSKERVVNQRETQGLVAQRLCHLTTCSSSNGQTSWAHKRRRDSSASPVPAQFQPSSSAMCRSYRITDGVLHPLTVSAVVQNSLETRCVGSEECNGHPTISEVAGKRKIRGSRLNSPAFDTMQPILAMQTRTINLPCKSHQAPLTPPRSNYPDSTPAAQPRYRSTN